MAWLRELDREDARERLVAADGARMGQTTGDDWESWRDEQARTAGLT